MGRTDGMNMILITILLGQAGAADKKEECLSGQYTDDGKCCKQCPPGEGVEKPCGATQTVCEPCLDSESFSENFSHTERCRPCTKCSGLFRMETPCTDANDAVCVCNYGLYLNELSRRCEPCTKCPAGRGMLFSCEADRDTVCEDCGGGQTYSDQESSREPCIPCSSCDEGDELQLQACTAVADTVCQEQYPSVSPTPFTEPTYVDFPIDEPPSDGPTDSGAPPTAAAPTTAANERDSHERIYKSLNHKLIPVYCSVLAAVAVGLVAFIVFKRWNSCKQNKQQANNCQASNQNQTPSPEGEKLHSDSGISVDSQSLQEQTQTHTAVTVDEDPGLLLPLRARDEAERLLFNGGRGGDGSAEDDWRNLAGLLGYEGERVAAFRQEQHPLRALLSDWAGKDGASVDALRAALRKINRDDVAQSLAPAPAKATATSMV
ncbi:nerve growth factor receptor b [Hippocampus zosterae]|uniref:nerve growth factor receptor b n=1 Tax=Hippocampus zosterae TaxID=109293 RepID=UPI00223E759D|nr:nerve growth factor receptor b [Hippocampus zosterae]